MPHKHSSAAGMQNFLIACNYISEGNRVAAATHLKAALNKIDRSKKPDLSIRADIEKLLADVERNAKAAQ